MCLRGVGKEGMRDKKVLLKYKFRVIWAEWGLDFYKEARERGWTKNTHFSSVFFVLPNLGVE